MATKVSILQMLRGCLIFIGSIKNLTRFENETKKSFIKIYMNLLAQRFRDIPEEIRNLTLGDLRDWIPDLKVI